MITVRRGDTLSSIAERELGSASHWTEIFRANRGQLSDPDELPVGMHLMLPKQQKSATTATSRHHDQHRPDESGTRARGPSCAAGRAISCTSSTADSCGECAERADEYGSDG